MSEPDYLDSDKYIEQYLEITKQKFEEGNKAVLLMAMHQCLLLKKPPPEWLRLAFIRAYESAAAFEIRSWDEAFGPPREKGAHLKAWKGYADLRYPVALSVALREPGETISPDLFDKIGSDLGIGKHKASDTYYKHGGRELAEAIEPLVPFLRDRINSGKI
jgi:hypothetical protein